MLTATFAFPHLCFCSVCAIFTFTACIVILCVFPFALWESITLSMQFTRYAPSRFHTVYTHSSFRGVCTALMRCECFFSFPFVTATTIKWCVFLFAQFDARFTMSVFVLFVPLCLCMTFLYLTIPHLWHLSCGVSSFSRVFQSMYSWRHTFNHNSKPGFCPWLNNYSGNGRNINKSFLRSTRVIAT